MFSALLLASDFDDTLLPTSPPRRGARGPPENREALAYFIAQGGLHRVHGPQRRHLRPLCPGLPMNAPAIVSGGGALYDYGPALSAVTRLPESAADLAVAAAFPPPPWNFTTRGRKSALSTPTIFPTPPPRHRHAAAPGAFGLRRRALPQGALRGRGRVPARLPPWSEGLRAL